MNPFNMVFNVHAANCFLVAHIASYFGRTNMNCFNMVLNVHATLFVANIIQPNTSLLHMVLHWHPACCFLVAHIAI